ncbi:hypothetical protein K0U83_11640 [bacterium]|nr:hypothetical protein [bacterium]
MDISVNAGVFRRLGASFEFLGAFMESSASMEMQRLMGEKILAKALLLVPVRTGALKSTGRVVKSQNRKNYEVRFGNGRIQYALVVEFGRIQFAPFAPRPYIRPAVRYASRHFKREARLVLDKAVAHTLPKVIK